MGVECLPLPLYFYGKRFLSGDIRRLHCNDIDFRGILSLSGLPPGSDLVEKLHLTETFRKPLLEDISGVRRISRLDFFRDS